MKNENIFEKSTYIEFETIFFSTKDKLFFFIKKYVREKMQAEDILQQCYFKLWEQMSHVTNKDNVMPLLYTFAKNLIVDYSRKEARRLTYMNEVTKTSAGFEEEKSLEIKEYTHIIKNTLDKLPFISKKIFMLNREDGLSYGQIAEELDIPTSTVRYHMSKALSFLRKELSDYPNLYIYLFILQYTM